MTDYPLDMQLVVDPLNPENVVREGAVFLYDPSDEAGVSPIALKDPSGLPLANPLQSNAFGFTQPCIVTIPRVKWKSGTFEGFFYSYDGLRNEAIAARAAAEIAQAAAVSAGADAASVAEAALAGAVSDAESAQAAAQAAAALVGAPADAAVETLVNAVGSATRAALAAAFGPTAAPILTAMDIRVNGSLLDGCRYIPQGDSNTDGFDVNTAPQFRGSYSSLASLQSNGTLRLVKNSGVGGYTSTQLKALFDSEVLAYNPTLVSLMPGRNDGQGAGYPSEMIAYVTEAHAKCKAAGVGLFLINTVPQGQAALSAPTGVTAQLASSIAGVLVPRTYRFKITAGNGPVQSTPTGETTPSAAVSVVVSNSTSSVRVFWDHVKGANFYGVYCETSDGSGTYGLLGYVPASASPGWSVGHRWVQSSAVGTLGAAPPAVNTTALANSQQANRARINAWLSQYAAKNNIPLVDIYSKLVDPATGMFQTGLTYDGTHLNGEGHKIVADAIWETIGPLMRPHKPPMMTSAADPFNLDTNGTFNTGSASLPTGYVATNTPSYEAGQTTHTRAPRAGFAGNALGIVATVPVVDTVVGPNLTGVAAGDKLRVSGKIETSLATGGGVFAVALKDQAGNTLTEWKVVAADIPPRAFTAEVIAPAGATSVHWELVLGGKGPVYFGESSPLNLTTNAWLDL